MGMDFRGDPSSALLEVLDPEQNATFMDHYLEVEYDLSDVMFVTTANTLNIPAPLMDRMEIIRIAGYTEDEKVEIARRHLLPKSERDHGLRPASSRSTTRRCARSSAATRGRPGVRNLERELATLGRKAVKELLTSEVKTVSITAENLEAYLGVTRYRYGEAELEDRVGVVTGLAWTEFGGELVDRGRRHDARQGPYDGDRQPARRDEGVDLGRGVLRPQPRDRLRHQAAAFRQTGHPRPRAGRRDPEGRPSAGIAMVTAIVS
jgi:ATP-dependent Lon protease